MSRRWLRILLGRRASRTLARVAVLAVVSVVTFGWILVPVRTHGISMQPTLEDGSLRFVNRLAFVGREPRRGDIVAIRLAGPRVLYVKRIIGVPGERILIQRGVLHVNDRPLSEPYVVHRAGWDVRETTLGANEYFVIGDNRGMRIEQHEFGTVSRDRIVGRLAW